MSSRKEYDPGLVKIGELLVKKRKALGEVNITDGQAHPIR